MQLFENRPAQTLEDLYKTLRPEPLLNAAEFKAFYRADVNEVEVRGEDAVLRMSRKLRQAYSGAPFKAFLMGHPGVGKSTEITRLLGLVEERYVGVRLNIASELNPASFKIFDVLLLMIIRLAEEANGVDAKGFGDQISAHLVTDIQQWFGSETATKTETGGVSGSVSAGGGAQGGSLLAGLFGLFASIKGEIKYASDRKLETVDYRLKRLSDLVQLCNKLIDACSKVLEISQHKEWLILIEDLDKTSIAPKELQDLFIQYGNVFKELRIGMVITIPVWLGYSSEGARLLFDKYTIHDTPVFNNRHEPHEAGRQAVQAVLEARVSPLLFEQGQMMRLIVASGGNLRDLFTLVLDAGEGAPPDRRSIAEEDSIRAINKMRRDYRQRLGQSPYDLQPISYEEKAKKLVALYNSEQESQVPDPALYSLLRARAVQEFNGTFWFGVHPLTADILKEQKKLPDDAPGGTT